MSINTMTSNAVRRIMPVADTPVVPIEEGTRDIMDDTGVGNSGSSTGTLGDTNILPNNAVSNVLGAMIVYIPTEIITLYIATVSAIATMGLDRQLIYWIFAVFTPIFALLVFLSKAASTGGPSASLPAPSQWPWWGMFSATVAFMIWALALPNPPFFGNANNASAFAGLGALFISTILSVLEPIALRFVKA